MLFLLSFLLLTLTYIIVFILIDTVHILILGVLGKRQRMEFKAAFKAAAGSLFDKPNEDTESIKPRINKANNKRWYYLVAMMIVTGFIAATNPGDPVLLSSVKELPKEVLSQETRDKVTNDWSVILHGPTKAKKMAEVAKAEEAKRKADEPNKKSWSWLAFFLIYLALVPPYAIIAFWDECVVGFKAAVAKFEEHRLKMAALEASKPPPRSGDGKSDSNGKRLGIIDVISWSVIMDLVVEFFSKFIAHRANGGRS